MIDVALLGATMRANLYRLLLLLSVCLWTSSAGATVTVSFINSESYTDMGRYPEDMEAHMKAIEAHLEQLGQRYLPPNQSLKIEVLVLVALMIASAGAAAAVSNPQFHIRPVDDAWYARLPRDAGAATQAYMERLPPEVVARANAYFEGGYWLQLWNFLLGLAISVVLLRGRRSARMRDWAQRIGRKAFFRDAIYGALFSIASFVLSLPLTIYQGFVREHDYGMATQTFGPWFGEQLIGLAVSTLLIALAVGLLYAVIRRAGERWWIWGTALTVGLLVGWSS